MADEVDENEQPIINVGQYDGPRNEIGEREGNGRSVYANKDVYVGDFKKGHRNGRGTYRWAYLGMQYKGEYVDGRRHGRGTMWYTNGVVYDGDWVEGRRQGYGRMEFPNGDVYDGQFDNGLPHGEGKYYYFTCDCMTQGTFEHGRIVKGALILRDGSKWTGEFRLNEPYGKGVWISADGWVQEGEYVEINPAQKDENEEEEEKPEEEAPEEEKPEEDEPDGQEQLDEQAKEGGEEKGEDGSEGEKPDPREKTLRALLKPVRPRKAIDYFDRGVKLEKMRTLKLRWIPQGLPVRQQE